VNFNLNQCCHFWFCWALWQLDQKAFCKWLAKSWSFWAERF